MQKYNVPSSHTASRGVTWGRPSFRTVDSQNTSARSSSSRASGHAVGVAPSPTQIAAIRAAIESDGQVSRLIHLRTEHLGPEDLLVGAKVEFDGDLRFPDVAKAIDSVEQKIRDAVPAARLIYLEPDVARTPT